MAGARVICMSVADVTWLAKQLRGETPASELAVFLAERLLAAPAATELPADVRELRIELRDAEQEQLRLRNKVRSLENEIARLRKAVA